jgi:predicted metal-dependent hydrolase
MPNVQAALFINKLGAFVSLEMDRPGGRSWYWEKRLEVLKTGLLSRSLAKLDDYYAPNYKKQGSLPRRYG